MTSFVIYLKNLKSKMTLTYICKTQTTYTEEQSLIVHRKTLRQFEKYFTAPPC